MNDRISILCTLEPETFHGVKNICFKYGISRNSLVEAMLRLLLDSPDKPITFKDVIVEARKVYADRMLHVRFGPKHHVDSWKDTVH